MLKRLMIVLAWYREGLLLAAFGLCLAVTLFGGR